MTVRIAMFDEGDMRWWHTSTRRDSPTLTMSMPRTEPGWGVEVEVDDDFDCLIGRFYTEHATPLTTVTVTLLGDGCFVTDDASNTYTEVPE